MVRLQLLYVCVLCASCGSSQCCIMHDLQFVNAARVLLSFVVACTEMLCRLCVP